MERDRFLHKSLSASRSQKEGSDLSSAPGVAPGFQAAVPGLRDAESSGSLALLKARSVRETWPCSLVKQSRLWTCNRTAARASLHPPSETVVPTKQRSEAAGGLSGSQGPLVHVSAGFNSVCGLYFLLVKCFLRGFWAAHSLFPHFSTTLSPAVLSSLLPDCYMLAGLSRPQPGFLRLVSLALGSHLALHLCVRLYASDSQIYHKTSLPHIRNHKPGSLRMDFNFPPTLLFP